MIIQMNRSHWYLVTTWVRLRHAGCKTLMGVTSPCDVFDQLIQGCDMYSEEY